MLQLHPHELCIQGLLREWIGSIMGPGFRREPVRLRVQANNGHGLQRASHRGDRGNPLVEPTPHMRRGYRAGPPVIALDGADP